MEKLNLEELKVEELKVFEVLSLKRQGDSLALSVKLNDKERNYLFKFLDNGIRAFSYPLELAIFMTNNPKVSHRLSRVLCRHLDGQNLDLPLNLLEDYDAIRKLDAA